MKAIFVVAAMIAAASAASIQEKHPIDWYDCSHKDDGNYYHPSDCTRFISCSGGIASERDCAICHVDPRRCPEGRLVYNATVDACLWADETECNADGGSGGGGSGESSEEQEETEAPEPTPGPITDPEVPEDLEGKPCKPKECKLRGWCQHYYRCNNVTEKWERDECGFELVWNPYNPDGSKHVHGGNCDTWDNLDKKTEDWYRSREECMRCYWKEISKCNQDYLYQKSGLKHRHEQRLSCGSSKLVFVKEKETCQRCQDAFKADGKTRCCL